MGDLPAATDLGASTGLHEDAPSSIDLPEGGQSRVASDVQPFAPSTVDMNVFVGTQDGRLFYYRGAIDFARHWSLIGELSLGLGKIGPLDELDAVGMGGDTLLLAARVGTQAFASAGNAAGSFSHWTPFAGDVSAVGITNFNGAPTVCALAPSGRVLIARREAEGRWRAFEDVTTAITTASLPNVTVPVWRRIDCLGIGDELQLYLIDHRGTLWSASYRNGWTGFEPVSAASGVPLEDVEAQATAGEVHLVGANLDTQFHAVRYADLRWEPMTDVSAGIGTSAGTLRASAAGAASAEVQFLRIAGSGELLHAIEFRASRFTPLASLAKPDTSPFTVAAAAATWR